MKNFSFGECSIKRSISLHLQQDKNSRLNAFEYLFEKIILKLTIDSQVNRFYPLNYQNDRFLMYFGRCNDFIVVMKKSYVNYNVEGNCNHLFTILIKHRSITNKIIFLNYDHSRFMTLFLTRPKEYLFLYFIQTSDYKILSIYRNYI